MRVECAIEVAGLVGLGRYSSIAEEGAKREGSREQF